jgi:hypothetical protein
MVSAMYWMNSGSVVLGPYPYDNRPIAWMPYPELPDEYLEKNKQTARDRGYV